MSGWSESGRERRHVKSREGTFDNDRRGGSTVLPQSGSSDSLSSSDTVDRDRPEEKNTPHHHLAEKGKARSFVVQPHAKLGEMGEEDDDSVLSAKPKNGNKKKGWLTGWMGF